MAAENQWTAHLPNDLSEELEDIKEKYDLTKSQTLRRVVRNGLNADQKRSRAADVLLHMASVVLSGAIVFGMLGIMLPYLSYVETGVGTLMLALIGFACTIIGVTETPSADAALAGDD